MLQLPFFNQFSTVLKILITGCAGFIGSNLAARIISEGHEVIGIDNFSYGFQRNIDPIASNARFTFIEGDVRDVSVFSGLAFDAIVHLASFKIPRYTNALQTLEDNNVMTKNVIEACIQRDAKLIFASTSDVYGKNPDLPFNEESNLVLGPTTVKRWAYATSKIYSEQLIIANNDEHKLRYTIVRFFGSYGPHQNLSWWGGPQSVFITKAFKDEEIELHGDGMQTRTFTFVSDTVDALFRCITDSRADNDIFNIGSLASSEISIKELAVLIWKLVRGEDAVPKLKTIPYETFGKYEDVRRRLPDISKIQERLGYTPQVGLEEGLIRAIEWQKPLIDEQ